MKPFYIIDQAHYLHLAIADTLEAAKETFNWDNAVKADHVIAAKACPHGGLLPPDVEPWMAYEEPGKSPVCSQCNVEHPEPHRKPSDEARRLARQAPKKRAGRPVTLYFEHSRYAL